jgi:hypothetical protein
MLLRAAKRGAALILFPTPRVMGYSADWTNFNGIFLLYLRLTERTSFPGIILHCITSHSIKIFPASLQNSIFVTTFSYIIRRNRSGEIHTHRFYITDASSAPSKTNQDICRLLISNKSQYQYWENTCGYAQHYSSRIELPCGNLVF